GSWSPCVSALICATEGANCPAPIWPRPPRACWRIWSMNAWLAASTPVTCCVVPICCVVPDCCCVCCVCCCCCRDWRVCGRFCRNSVVLNVVVAVACCSIAGGVVVACPKVPLHYSRPPAPAVTGPCSDPTLTARKGRRRITAPAWPLHDVVAEFNH